MDQPENTTPPLEESPVPAPRPRGRPKGSKSKPKAPAQALTPPKPKRYYPANHRPPATPEQMAERRRLHESRVEYVADLMRSLQFRMGATTKALAKEWDLPLSAASEISIDASRRVRAEYTDHDRVLSKIAVSLDRVIDDALASGDRHAIIKAVQVWAQVTGAGAATKVEITRDLTSMTPEQLQARKAEILARLTGKPLELIGEVVKEGE